MTVAQAAEHFKVSKEAIHNRIRRGSLNSIVENGVKYVAVAEVKSTPSKHEDQRYYDYIEEENTRLRERVNKLENETTSLRDKREASLIAEREKIEQIYKERDEQLRTVLHVVASKFLTAQNMNQVIDDAVSSNETSEDAEVISEVPIVTQDENDAISDPVNMKRGGIVMLITICGFLVHGALGLQPCVVAMAGATLALAVCNIDIEHSLEKIEWGTLFFFIGLFYG